MALLVESGAALQCEGSEDGNGRPPCAHVKISSLTLFAKVEYGAKKKKNYSTPSKPVISTDCTFCVVRPKKKHSPLCKSNDKYSTVSLEARSGTRI